MAKRKKTKGDGSELCCMVNPSRKHKHCTLSLCLEHGWNDGRRLLGLRSLTEDLKLDKGCPRCGKAAGTEGEWDLLQWP